MKRPLACLALAFSLGIIVASRIKISPSIIYSLSAIFMIFSLLSFKKRILFDIFLSCLIFSLGLALLKNSQELPRCHIHNLIYYKDKEPYIVKGYINSQPVAKNNKESFIFKAQAIQSGNLNHACCGNILVYLKGKKELDYGEGLILRGNLYRPFNRQDSYRHSHRDYLYNQDIRFIMNVKTKADVIRLNRNQGFILKRFALWLKHKIEGIIFQRTSLLTGAILDAMILGEKRNIPSFLNNAMMKTGTVHILVVSGFNVGIVSFIIILFLKLIRLPRKIRFAIATPCLVVYCLMTGASTPVVRAAVMAIFFMLGFLMKREPDIYNSLSAALLFILAFNPRQLFDIGFQLSFSSVIAIVYLYPRIKSYLHIESLKIKYLRFLLDGCLVSFSAWLGTLGFIAYYFRILSPITVLANIFIVPLATLITLCGFSLMLMSLIFSPLAPFFASTAELLVAVLVKVNAFLVRLPAAYLYLP
jgi:competence protein ComEC